MQEVKVKEINQEPIDISGGISRTDLKQLIERLERLEEEKQELATTIREALQDAKNRGFDINIIKQVLKIRRSDPQEISLQHAELVTYLSALGMSLE